MSDNKNDEKPTLTDRDVEILICAVRCMEGGLPKPDMQKFAEMAGFKNTNSASVCLNLVKKKLMGDAAPAKTPKKATPSGKRKQSTPKDAGEDDMEETPTKKMKPTPKKGGKTGAAVKDDSEEDSITALV